MTYHVGESVPYRSWSLIYKGPAHEYGEWEALQKDSGEILNADSYDAIKRKVDESNGHWYTR